MRVFIIHIRSLLVGAAVLLVAVAAGLYLLLGDPLDVSEPLRDDPANLLTVTGKLADPFASVKPTLQMDVEVDGDTAHVKLNTDHFTFSGENSNAEPLHGQGHAHLYLNGKLLQMVHQPEFVLKRLPKGTHELRVELVYNNHMPYQVDASEILEVK